MSATLVSVSNLAWRPSDDDDFLFRGLDLTVDAGERLALVGPSGAGKSTLLRCLAALEPRPEGELCWRGEPVEPGDVRTYRRRVAYLHQEPAAVAETVGENLAFAREMGAEVPDREPLDETDQRDLLARLDLADLDSSRAFEHLSVGERQRVAFVRTLTVRPDVLLLDEPTASLDDELADELEAMIRDFVDTGDRERAILVVSHDRSRIEAFATRILDLGELVTPATDVTDD